MCKIPLNSPVQTVELDILSSEDEADIAWSEFESTISSSITMNTSTTPSATMSHSFSTVATTLSSDEDFCGFTDDDLAYVDTDDEDIEEYYLTDYLETTGECSEGWDDTEYLDEDVELENADSDPEHGNWEHVAFPDEEFCNCVCRSQSSIVSNPLTATTLDDIDDGTDDKDNEAVRYSSYLVDFYQDEIAECAKEVLGIKGQNHLGSEYGFDVSMIGLPGEENCTCEKWLPLECEQSNVFTVSDVDFVLSDPYTVCQSSCFDETMPPRFAAELTNISGSQHQ